MSPEVFSPIYDRFSLLEWIRICVDAETLSLNHVPLRFLALVTFDFVLSNETQASSIANPARYPFGEFGMGVCLILSE